MMLFYHISQHHYQYPQQINILISTTLKHIYSNIYSYYYIYKDSEGDDYDVDGGVSVSVSVDGGVSVGADTVGGGNDNGSVCSALSFEEPVEYRDVRALGRSPSLQVRTYGCIFIFMCTYYLFLVVYSSL